MKQRDLTCCQACSLLLTITAPRTQASANVPTATKNKFWKNEQRHKAHNVVRYRARWPCARKGYRQLSQRSHCLPYETCSLVLTTECPPSKSVRESAPVRDSANNSSPSSLAAAALSATTLARRDKPASPVSCIRVPQQQPGEIVRRNPWKPRLTKGCSVQYSAARRESTFPTNLVKLWCAQQHRWVLCRCEIELPFLKMSQNVVRREER